MESLYFGTPLWFRMRSARLRENLCTGYTYCHLTHFWAGTREANPLAHGQGRAVHRCVRGALRGHLRGPAAQEEGVKGRADSGPGPAREQPDAPKHTRPPIYHGMGPRPHASLATTATHRKTKVKTVSAYAGWLEVPSMSGLLRIKAHSSITCRQAVTFVQRHLASDRRFAVETSMLSSLKNRYISRIGERMIDSLKYE